MHEIAGKGRPGEHTTESDEDLPETDFLNFLKEVIRGADQLQEVACDGQNGEFVD